MVIHKRPPVRESRHEFGALLNGAFDVQNQFFFGIVWLQGSDIIEQAPEALLLAILAEIVLADSAFCKAKCKEKCKALHFFTLLLIL